MQLDYIVKEQDHLRKAGRLAAHVFYLSQHDMTVIKESGSLLADGKPIRLIDRVPYGTRLSVILPDEPMINKSHMPYIIYEDEALRIIDKPAGIPTMASSSPDSVSLEKLYICHYGNFRPVNRLDKGTGGLMVCATTGYFQHILSGQLHTDHFIREYLAVVEGRMSSDYGMIDFPIAHSPHHTNLRCVDPHGKPSITYYRMIRETNGRSLIRLRLITGRTHQIRVHLSAIGHPICGDYLYGAPLPGSMNSFALHSAYLFLTHPLTKEMLFFSSDPMVRFMQYLENKSIYSNCQEKIEML